MNPTIVGDHIRHREGPGVPLLREHVGANAGQRPLWRDQLLVHVVHPPGEAADPIQIQQRNRGAGQHAGPGAGRNEGTHRLRAQFHVGVQVDAGKGTAGLVAEPERVRLTWHRRLNNPHTGLPGHLSRAVGAGVGNHDDVELAGSRRGEEPAQIVRDDGFLVVCRHNDADHRSLCDVSIRRLAHRASRFAHPLTQATPCLPLARIAAAILARPLPASSHRIGAVVHE